MKLKSIEIINFRRFYGSQTIEFSVDDEKSWTFVHAENGTGKSNFLSAINWVLYGELTKGSENPDNIINTTHALEKKQLAYAEVKLEILTDENKSLRLIRKITKKTPDPILKAYWINDIGDSKKIPESLYESLINSFLPKELSQYFLFHGEGVKNLTNNKKNIDQAVRDIQGITDANQILEDIAEAQTKILKEMEKDKKNSKRKRDLLKEINLITENIKKHKGIIDEKTEERDSANSLIDEITKVIEESDHAKMKEIEKNINFWERDLNIKNTNLNNHLSSKYKNSQLYAGEIMNFSVSKKFDEIQKNLEQKGQWPGDLSTELIESIIEKKECICGNCVEVGSDEFKNLNTWIEKATSKEYTSEAMGLSNISDVSDTLERFQSANVDFETTKGMLEEEISILKNKIIEEKPKLKGFDKDIDGLIEQRDKLKNDRDKYNDDIKTSNNIIGVNKAKRSPLQIQLDGIKGNEDNPLDQKVQFLKEAESRLETILSSTIKKAQQFIQEKMKSYIDEFATKDFSLDFENHGGWFPVLKEKNIGGVYTEGGDSTGEKLLKNVAFVGALVEHCNSKNDSDNKFQIKGAKPPLVVDAPFGDGDDRYSAAIANILIMSNAQQVIVFLSKKHYNGGFEAVIEPKNVVGRRYILENYTTKNELKKIKDVEDNKHIIIGKKKHKQIFEAEEFGYSKFKEVS